MNPVETAVRLWLNEIVVGLNLCPFAAAPLRQDRVRVSVSEAEDELALLTELEMELRKLDEAPLAEIETTVIAVPRMLADFADYNDFLDRVDELLEQFDWAGEFQVASFHPHYQFAGTEPGDAENLSNRAPPLLHLLREASVEVAVDGHPDPDSIPAENIRKLRELSPQRRQTLFAYLDAAPAQPEH